MFLGFSPEDGAVCFSETVTSTDESTRRQDPEEQLYKLVVQ
jgi:hypothetical protein